MPTMYERCLLLGATVALSACAQTQVPVETEPPPPPEVTTIPGASGDGSLDPDTLTLDSKITAVTVYSDRARVTREVTADIGDTPRVFAIKNLPGWVDDGSVRVSTSAGTLLDVQVNRRYLAQATDQRVVDTNEAHQRLLDKLTELDDELAILAAQEKQVEAIRAFSTEKLSQDGVTGNLNIAAYGSVVNFVSDTLRSTAKQKREVQRRRRLLMPEINASKKTVAEIEGLTRLEETMVLLTLHNPTDVSAKIELTYMLPGATWEPAHELRADSNTPDKLDLVSYAVVTQTSGEDWDDATIHFSTQSSTEAVQIPELDALKLDNTSTTSRMIKRKVKSFSRAQQAYDSQNMTWNSLQNKSSQHNFEQSYRSNFEFQQVIQSKTVQLFQRLKNRGTSAHYVSSTRTAVRGDGRSVRLRIGGDSLKARVSIVAAPENSLNAAHTFQLTNSSAQALLPGKVTIFQDGAFLGLTDLDFVAEGEQFSMFAGVADHLKLSRKLNRKQSSIVRKKRTKMTLSFTVTVENLKAQPTSLKLTDRIPVSENKEISVSNVKITPGVKPDTQGLITWQVDLQPKEKRTFEISYNLEYPPTLIMETNRNKNRRPNKSKRYDLEDQIFEMEKLF